MEKNNTGNNFFNSRINSFGYAFKGIGHLLKTQTNARIHLIIALMVIILGSILPVNRMEWIMLVLVIGLVFGMELINTALEYFTDLISPSLHPTAGRIKDLAAGAVLVTAIAAAVTGCIIFIPKIF